MPVLDLGQAPAVIALDPGVTAGTFRLDWRGNVTWAGTPEWPVTVAVATLTGDVAAEVEVSGPDAFVLAAHVSPGTWMVRSEPPAAAEGTWWTALGPVLDVDGSGVARCQSNCRGGLLHGRKVEIVWPGRLETVIETRPTLRWNGLPGADHYGVRWFELPTDAGASKLTEPVRGTSYTFPVDLVPARKYEWDVDAYDASGTRIGWMNGYFLTPGPAGPPVDAVPASWLGVALVDVPDRGVVIGSVVPGSPAAAAGLPAGVVVVSVDGVPVTDARGVRAFVGRQPPGTRIAIVAEGAAGERTTYETTLATRPSTVP